MVRLGRAAIANHFRRQVEGKARPPVKSLRQCQQHPGPSFCPFPGGGSGTKAVAAAKTPFFPNGTIHEIDCSALVQTNCWKAAAVFKGIFCAFDADYRSF